jgi:Domain of unknown function (DUF5668)
MVDPIQPAQPVQGAPGQIVRAQTVQVQSAPSAQPVCHCAYCRIRALFGPIMIIAVGVVFMVAQYSRFSFSELWPILLIVAGILKVAENMAPRDGHPA